jgi:succinate dehydrogenase hydrophobic anchor subunit
LSDQEIEYAALLKRRHLIAKCFEWGCRIATGSALLFLAVLLAGVIWQAWGWLDLQFLTGFDSRRPANAGLLAGIWGTFWLILFTTIFTVPMGVGAAIYLEEYATDNRLTRLIKLNLSNLAGVPSIVYGMLGVTAFVRMFGLISAADGWTAAISLGFGTLEIPLPLGRCLLAGSFTQPVDPAGCDHCVSGSIASRAAFDSPCVLRFGSDGVADNSAPGFARCRTWHRDRNHSGVIPSDGRNRTTDHDRSVNLPRLHTRESEQPDRSDSGSSASPGRTIRHVYVDADSDFQLGRAAEGRISERSGCWKSCAFNPAGRLQCHCGCDPQSSSEANFLVIHS